MADTDIYKNREPIPAGKKPEKKRRRRRSGTDRAFDDKTRKRRSKNSGLRRFLHLSRKAENEKIFWWTAGILVLALLISVAIWQFFVSERLIRQQEAETEQMEHQPHIPNNVSNGSKEPIL